MTSLALPAASGTTAVMARAGQACASAGSVPSKLMSAQAIAKAMLSTRYQTVVRTFSIALLPPFNP
jgi:hypothetical protein